jgi:ATP-dependent helicase/nuclease subunit A
MQPSLFDLPIEELPPDQAAREFAVDPANNVLLEASAGTGKTRVLVDRYVRLIADGVSPRNILAITFTRKAAGEMRDRILAALRDRARADVRIAARWRELRERISDIQISTIDAFCFSLLREFPLEARVNPGFEIADDTEIARFTAAAVDRTLRVCRGLIVSDENVRLLCARVKLGPFQDALQRLLDRRHVSLPVVNTFVARHTGASTPDAAARAFVERLVRVLGDAPAIRAVIEDGPAGSAEYRWLRQDLLQLDVLAGADPARVQQLHRRLEQYFTRDGTPRARAANRFTAAMFASSDSKRRHDAAIKALAPAIAVELDAFRADVHGLLARGLQRVLAIAVDQYEALLDEHGVLDFAGMLAKSVELLSHQEEFARSRLKLQARFHHVLVDEFQDTSRLQWKLVELLIDAWGEGEGAQDAPTSIFVVGDRKQSIYRFRHAEVRLLDEAARRIAAIRPGARVRQAITHSFRAVPELLAFVNAVSVELQSTDDVEDRFTYSETDRFPIAQVGSGARRDGAPVLGVIAQPSIEACARAVAAEVVRLLSGTVVRDRDGSRPARPDDIAILFRARAGHQFFEAALEEAGVSSYVYKGLGFFDAPEVQDLQALIRYLAQPDSDLRAAEFLRSRLVRLTDAAIAALAPALARSLIDPDLDVSAIQIDDGDKRLLEHTRERVASWLPLVDRIGPSELIDRVLRDSAYVYELRGRRFGQARENLKKVRALVRRIENRGYATVARVAEYFATLRAGDDSNAAIEAAGCVHLMTIHASKGLERPIVFVVNLHAPGRSGIGPFAVVERGPDGEPAVVFGKSDATRLEELREREELRRLLYVAMTRARDRLYLAAEINESNQVRRGQRSLAGLLPPGMAEMFSRAAAAPEDEVDWQSSNGSFSFRVCRPCETGTMPRVESNDPGAIDRIPVVAVGPDVVRATDTGDPAGWELAASEAAAATENQVSAAGEPADRSERLVGTLVHRLFQRQLPPELSQSELAQSVPALLKVEESVDVSDLKDLSARVAETYFTLRQQPELQELLSSGVAMYELPFSLHQPGPPAHTIRGRIDCVIQRPDGSVVVVELKTGHRRAEHQIQLDVYRRAVAEAMPHCVVDARLVYA